ncbi:hypothetical protein OHT93_19590 [Streptomyces sp. NBC_00191]|uniref:hypothetical protein n=1 Tax=Streptomyces sp. NBC_00191 TaxID=2975674 RepID=UPI0032441BF3
MTLTRQALEESGFTGFVSFAELPCSQIPEQGGIYVVLRSADGAPVFLATSTAGWRNQRNPAVSVEKLTAAWVAGTEIVYIGKASDGAAASHGLRGRIAQYGRHGLGGTSHHGGRYIWQLQDATTLLVGWKTTPGVDPRKVEKALLADFRELYGSLPFANLQS